MKIIFALLLFVTFSAFAGGTSGGGGKGVVCIDSAGQETVELLDIWEARTLFGQAPAAFPPGTTLQTAVEILIDRLKFVIPTAVVPNVWCNQGNCFKEYLLKEAAKFLSPNSSVIRLNGVELEETDDSFELAKPKLCDVRQLVNYQDYQHIYLDEDRFQKMDLLNQAALITHEALYSKLRSWYEETNSIRTRRAVGYVSTGLSFTDISDLHKPKTFVNCKSSEPYYSNTSYDIDFWPANDPNIPNRLQLLPNIFDRSRLMGITNWDTYFRTAGGMDNLYDFISTGKCNTGNTGGAGSKTFLMTGPVEFDRGMWLGLDCDDKSDVFTVTVKSRKPGFKQWTDPVALTCQEHRTF